MRFGYSVLLGILASVVGSQADCSLIDGNYYCSETTNVVYTNVGYSGTYQDVTNMDEDTGECTQEDYSFSGNLAPLDEELSVHFRGPLKLLQFAVYLPASEISSKKKKREEAKEDCTTQHLLHKHKRATQIVEVTQTVVVDSEGNTYTSEETTTATAATTASGADSGDESTSAESSAETSAETSTKTSATTSSSSTSTSSSVVSGDWERIAYYEPGSTDNVTFFNYYGGSGSGVWSTSFGNSLSYANDDASGASESAVALLETTIESDVEYIIMSGTECDDDCGYYRSGIPAYHGFGGSEKIFFFEFEMPTATDSSSTTNYDMPAIWLLNAKIPRTLQYGDSTCSCWSTGCGELDLFEILTAGSDKLICHLHDGQGDDGTSTGGGGTQDYFTRPTNSSMKAAVIFSGSEIRILEIDDLDLSIEAATVSSWLDSSGSTATLSS